MKHRDKLPEPVDLLKLPCAVCGGKSERLFPLAGGLALPICSGCDMTHPPAKVHDLAHKLDMLAQSGDIMACQELLVRKRAGVFGG